MNPEWWFPESAWYRAMRAELRIAEPAMLRGEPLPTERQVQCVWYDPRLRPAPLATAAGESVEVECPGRWNLEAGPDFRDAVLRLGPDRRRLRGDVEVHVRPGDWTAHGHLRDPAYAGVCLHVTYLAGALLPEELPDRIRQISLRAPLAARPGFAFDDIDVAAYPYTVRTPPSPCASVLGRWTPDRREALLSSAGEERLRQKTERMVAAIERRGAEQAVYEEWMAALGYAGNKTPFRRLAERVPLSTVREFSGGNPIRAYALLAGAAGLLPGNPDPAWDEETLRFWRALWDLGWKAACPMESAPAPVDWKLKPLRPLNHPLRRLMAAAQWFARGPDLPERVLSWMREKTPARIRRAAMNGLDVAPEGYWARRVSWGGPLRSRPEALVGPDRAGAILINVITPFAAALAVPPETIRMWIEALPPEPSNQLLRETARALFGPDHPPSLYRSGLRRQGLMQIFRDFCLNDRSHCTRCSFPRRLESACLADR